MRRRRQGRAWRARAAPPPRRGKPHASGLATDSHRRPSSGPCQPKLKVKARIAALEAQYTLPALSGCCACPSDQSEDQRAASACDGRGARVPEHRVVAAEIQKSSQGSPARPPAAWWQNQRYLLLIYRAAGRHFVNAAARRNVSTLRQCL